jgi:molecular chaperone GrpE
MNDTLPEEDKNINDELKAALAEAERARDEYLAGWQRAKADFINYKQDERRRFDDTIRYGIEGIIRDMIIVLDTFDFAVRIKAKQPPRAEPDLYAEGVEKEISIIRSQIEDILKKRGVERIPIKPGDPFDPMMMEAMAEIASESPIGTVIEEIEPGYRLYDKILRASRVIVSKGNEILK